MYLRGRWGVREIARKLYRDHSVISREVARNKGKDRKYTAQAAQDKAVKRMSREQKRKLDEDEVLRKYVVKGLRQEFWSPQQIAGKLKNRPCSQTIGHYVCHEAIYQWIYEGEGRFLGLYQHLPRQHKKRRKHTGRKSRNDKGISFITPIVYRPKEVEEKQEFGNWESDSVIGSTRPSLSVQKERMSQLLRLTLIPDMTAISTEEALRRHIEELGSEHWKTITFDRGSEGAHHWKLRLDYGVDTYHCDPYCSYQKGGVEQMNSRIRRFLPKGTDFSLLTQYDIYAIQEKINNTPLKILEYKTANEFSRELIGR
jgi:IS30 family transposase